MSSARLTRFGAPRTCGPAFRPARVKKSPRGCGKLWRQLSEEGRAASGDVARRRGRRRHLPSHDQGGEMRGALSQRFSSCSALPFWEGRSRGIQARTRPGRSRRSRREARPKRARRPRRPQGSARSRSSGERWRRRGSDSSGHTGATPRVEGSCGANSRRSGRSRERRPAPYCLPVRGWTPPSRYPRTARWRSASGVSGSTIARTERCRTAFPPVGSTASTPRPGRRSTPSRRSSARTRS